MSSLEVLQDIRQLGRRVLAAQGQDTVNNVIGPALVGGIEVSGFGGRLERPHDNPGRIGTKIESLTVQELDLRQMTPRSWSVERLGAERGANFGRLSPSRCARRISARLKR